MTHLMGWLRDMMSQAEPPLRSYAELARRVLESPDWPDEPRPQPRSLAALFSKLDREQELEWLADRVHVQNAIAQATGARLSDVARAADSDEDASRSRRLDLLPNARELDLKRESLCPGLPLELEQPSGWQHAWWQFSSRAEADFVEAWHRARGLCQVLRLDDEPLARRHLAVKGPLLLSIAAPEQLDLAILLEKPDLCVVAPCSPHAAKSGESAASRAQRFHLLEAPEPAAYTRALVGWVAKRLPPDTSFDTEQVLGFLERNTRHPGLTLSVNVLCGLCSAIDELDIGDLSRMSLEALAQRYIDHCLRQVDSQDPATVSWLRRAGLDVVAGICSRIIIDGKLAADEPRSFDAWLELVPAEFQRGSDLDWMRLALAGTDSPIRPSDIAEAAKHISPGSFRIVRALSQTRLLAKARGNRLVLTPAWLMQVALGRARERLLDASLLEWGEALLNVFEARNMLGALIQRTVDQDFGPVESALELDAEDDPAADAALEASFVAVGMALLSGTDVPQDLIENVWDETLRLLIETDVALPLPRTLFAEPGHLPPCGASCFEVGWFYLAALAISEQLPQGAGRTHELLRPWALATPPGKLSKLYDSLSRVKPDYPYPPYSTVDVLALVDRLRSSIGQASLLPHELEWPGIVLDEASHEVLSQASLEALDALPDGPARLHELSRRRECDWQSIAVACWRAWQAAACPAARPSYLARDNQHAGLFWESIPAELLETQLLAHNAQAQAPLPFEHFGSEQWSVFADACKTEGIARAHQTAFDAIPSDTASQCLDTALENLPANVVSKLWQRFADLLKLKAQQWLAAAQLPRAFKLIEAAPHSDTLAVIQLLKSVLVLRTLQAADMNLLRLWLVQRCTARQAGWREAYAYLSHVEETLAPLRASGLRR